MTKRVKDEFVEHHEGQAIFTTRRVIFGAVLFCGLMAIGFWIGVSQGEG